MASSVIPRCDCCGTPVDPLVGDYCHNCRYPVEKTKEQAFLQHSLNDLRRVAFYGGAQITVNQLIQHYQRRLQYISQPQNLPLPTPVNIPPAQATSVPPTAGAVPTTTLTEPAFSPRSFLADQSINVVASLGAFLILVGSLSFIITSSDRLLSFLVLLIVHAIFGAIGILSYRFRSFRTVAAIYTTIFALQVPLVGFTGYQLLAGTFIHLSASTIITIVAAYATIVYSALAIYQKFSPFSYLAAVSIVVADLALASATHLGGWWWSPMLMLIAIPALIAVSPTTATPPPLFAGAAAVLRGPVRLLTFACALICALALPLTTFYSLGFDLQGQPLYEVRFSLICITLLLTIWLCLFVWRSGRKTWLSWNAQLFLAFILAIAYAFSFNQTGYILVLTAVALLYYLINRFASRLLAPFPQLAQNLDILALLLIGILPFVVDPLLPLQVLLAVYPYTSRVPLLSPHFQLTNTTLVGIVALAVSFLISILLILRHTGLKQTLEPTKRAWCMLLLLSGFILNCLYALILLALHLDPITGLLAYTLFLTLVAVLLRRFLSPAWSNPIDILALCAAAETLLLSMQLDADHSIALLLLFTVLSYGVVLYQRRATWLFLPIVFSTFALIPLFSRPTMLLTFSLLLPPVAAVVSRYITSKRNTAPGTPSTPNQPVRTFILWEWPLLVIAFFYGLIFSMHDAGLTQNITQSTVQSTMQSWFGLQITFPVALEVATLALVWYISAILARVKWLQAIAILFAVFALLFPSNALWAMVALVALLALLAMGTSRFIGRDWAIALYVVASFATVISGVNYASDLTIAYILFFYALLAYAILLWERQAALLWVVTGLIFWSMLKLPDNTLHLGSLALATLAALIAIYGRIQPKKSLEHWCNYSAGLVLALLVTWELHAFHQTQISVLSLPPATYLIVIAPFLARDEQLPNRHQIGQLCSIIGAITLILPTLWLSFGPNNLAPALLLLSEALALFLLGIVTRIRFFLLSGAAMVIISAIHLLFLPSLGIPTFLAFTLVGILMLILATVLILIRPRLKSL